MPWRGAEYPGEFPSLGYAVGKWMENSLVIPDGYRMGEPFELTDEMWRFLIRFYRLWPDARVWEGKLVSPEQGLPRALRYTGAQLRRSQKWGKDPFGAAIVWAEALGPSRFDGWDAYGEPVGKPYPTPLIVELGTGEDQTDNTWRPTRQEVLGGDGQRPGPLNGDQRITSLDLAKITLRSGGKIEPVTTSAKARLGAPMTFVTITESHLFTLRGGYREVAGAVKRNVAGMDGRWLELTNAWDPTEASEAQVTAEARDHDVLIDTIEPQRVEDLDDEEALVAELRRQYGDSNRERGGWVNLERMKTECQSARHLESDRRRFFLNEIVVGESTFVLPERWDKPGVLLKGEQLQADEPIALGFDGAKYRDATVLVGSRISDGCLFELGLWERPKGAPEDWTVPFAEVDAKVQNVFAAYAVAVGFFDPWRWQDYLVKWAASYPGRIVEFNTNIEQRMDKALNRFMTSFANGEIKHAGDPDLTRHVKNAVIVKGMRKKAHPGEEDAALSPHYLKLAKRGPGLFMDGAVACTLAHAARGHAIEHNLVPKQDADVWGFVT